MKINILLGIGILSVIVISSCENEEVTYPDFDYQTVYFANQYPVRTIELGEDLNVDNSMDNEHKFEIKATTGGAYRNKNDIVIDFQVDESLCDSLYYSDGVKVTPMPSDYYQLAANQMTIPAGSILGGVEVQLNDAFFEDANSLGRYYVIPLLLTSVEGADSILQGTPLTSDPNRCVEEDWSVKPRDFVLYAVKYVNPYHGNYLRRGTDNITALDGSKVVSVRHEQYVEDNEVVTLTTESLTDASVPMSLYDEKGKSVYDIFMNLSFAEDSTCTVSGSDGIYTLTGTGKFVTRGDKNSIGGTDRNALYLDYKVTFGFVSLAFETNDTLVVRDRGVAPEYFTVEHR